MNNKTLVSDRLNELYKKYFQNTDYKVGDSFESVKDNMSLEDYDTSQKLLNYYSQQNSLADQYNYSNKVVEQERNKALQENSIAKEKTMKYLPEYLKLQGMGGLGLSESSIISANNNYRNQRNTINANADSQKADLLEKYQANINTLDQNAITDSDSIRAKYQAIRDEEILGQYTNFVELLNNGGFNNMDEVYGAYNTIKDNLTDAQRTNAENHISSFDSRLQKKQNDQLYTNFVEKLNYGEFNTVTELESEYNNFKDKLTTEQRQNIESKISYYKNNNEQIENDINYKKEHGQELTEEEQKVDDKNTKTRDENIINGVEPVEYKGSKYKISSKIDSSSNLITRNNDFKDQLKNLGYSGPYDSRIVNGTTLIVKGDNRGSNDFNFWDDVGAFLFSPLGHGAWDSWGNNKEYCMTYYNGNWYNSSKQ